MAAQTSAATLGAWNLASANSTTRPGERDAAQATRAPSGSTTSAPSAATGPRSRTTGSSRSCSSASGSGSPAAIRVARFAGSTRPASRRRNERRDDEGARLPRAPAAGLGNCPRPGDSRGDGRDRQDRHLDDLRHGSAHPQGRRLDGRAGPNPRPRGGRNSRRDRGCGDHACARGPRARLVHHVLRALPVLQGGPLWPLHGWRRLDLRPPDRRSAGRVREGAVRRHVRLQAPARADGRAGGVSRGHPPDGLRGRSALRPRRAGRHRRDRRRWADRPRGGDDRETALARTDRRAGRRRRAAREGARVRRRRHDQQRQHGSKSRR